MDPEHLKTRPLPEPTIESEPFWQACREHRLKLQFCQDCDSPRWYPSTSCIECASSRLEWRQVTGLAKVHSYTIVHRGSNAYFAKLVPYVVALVELAEGPMMMTSIVGDDRFNVSIGMEVTVEFEDVDGEDVTIPVFRRATG